MTGSTTSKTSMIIDGIAASEAIDSSGEILDVKGCDISDFENGVGLFNYEHRGDDATGASGNDIVGKITYAKKIFKKDDCDDKRQEAYWETVKLPFVYVKGRLYDGSGHAGAQSLAAAIRDAVTHNEPILARFSIEGSTLKKEGQRLARTIARKVAITFKPANKSAISGLVSDPNAVKPITEKQADKSLLAQLLEESAIKSDRPDAQRLGGYSMDLRNVEVAEDPAEMLKAALDGLKNLLKTTTGSMPDAAPSTLTGGAALQREDDRLHRGKGQLKQDLRAAVRDLPMSARANKGEMLKFFKFKLPEVNDGFLAHFTDLIDDVRTRQVGDWVEKTMGVWDAVRKAEARGAEQALATQEPEAVEPPPTPEKSGYVPTPEKSGYVPSPESANPAEVAPPTAAGVALSAQGELLSRKLTQAKAKLQLYDYRSDSQFMSVLHADDASKSPDLDPTTRAKIIKYVHKPWLRASQSWLALNKLAMAGDLPPSVIAHAAIFAAMSPNTSVPMQELYFGHYMDFSKKYGDIFLNPQGIDPKDAEHFHKWLNKNTPPEFFKEFYLQNGSEKGGISFGADKKQTINPKATLKDRPQGVPLLNYHRFHPLLTSLLKEVKDDGRAYSDFLMQRKNEHGATSMMPGFGPKLARYQALLMGQGNVVVPDRHFVRSLFNLSENDEKLGYLFNTLTPTRGERLLRGIDHQFNQSSPGVAKTVDMFPDHFQNRRMQANALGFWLQWLCLPHYNALRGTPGDALNMGAAHDPYFKAVKDILDKEGIPHDMADVGEIYKSEEPPQRQFGAPLPARVARATKAIEDQFGEHAAAFFYYSFGIPALFAQERNQASAGSLQVRKMESLAIEIASLSKAFGQDKPVEQAIAPQEWPPSEQKEIGFQGQPVKPGFATIYANTNGDHVPEGRKMAILGRIPASPESPQGDWLMVPHEKLGIHGAHDLEKWRTDGSAEIHQEPVLTEARKGFVHAALHVPQHYVAKDIQNKMVHGLDMTAENWKGTPTHHRWGSGEFGGWKNLPNDKLAFIKSHKHSPTGLPSSSHAEALFHNAMHHFGLGEYVTPAAIFQHPDARPHQDAEPNDWWSASEGVDNASHYEGKASQKDMLHSLYRTGELDKLGMVDQILGNTDRHNFNYLFGGDKGDKLFMIDHGDSFPNNDVTLQNNGDSHFRDEAHRGAVNREQVNETLHPDAKKWLLKQKPEAFQKFLEDHKTPVSVGHAALNKLKAMQEYAKEEPNASYHEVVGWPAEKYGYGNEKFDGDTFARAGIDREFGMRHTARKNKVAADRTERGKKDTENAIAIREATDGYLEHAANGGDQDPFEFLVTKLGIDGAKHAIAPHAGPQDFDKLIRDFNQKIRHKSSKSLRNRER